MRGYPQFSFLDSDGPCWDPLYPRSHRLRKNIILLGGRFLKKRERSEMGEDVCAVKKRRHRPCHNHLSFLFNITI